MVKECLVYLDLECLDVNDFLKTASELICETSLIDNSKLFYEALLKREQEITTGVGKGIAFPHACGRFVKAPFIALFRLKKAIDYNSIDSQPVDLFFMIGTPVDAEEVHLKILSRLAQNLAENEFKAEIRASNDANLIYQALKNVFKPMVIVITDQEDERETLLNTFSPRVNFYFYKSGEEVEPFEIHIADLTVSLKAEHENRLVKNYLTLDEMIAKVDELTKY